ncbi:MAG TPA: hypothetical protein VM008_21335 [Phycisphaerae bacterium]|nr:hypothetical protein [Phycisphaerae bacterium]
MADKLIDKIDLNRYGAWLSPDGEVFHVGYEGHGVDGGELAERYNLYHKNGDVYTTLFKHGWVRLVFSSKEFHINADYWSPMIRLALKAAHSLLKEGLSEALCVELGGVGIKRQTEFTYRSLAFEMNEWLDAAEQQMSPAIREQPPIATPKKTRRRRRSTAAGQETPLENGKGDTPRPYDRERFAKEFDRIFRHQQSTPKPHPQCPPHDMKLDEGSSTSIYRCTKCGFSPT